MQRHTFGVRSVYLLRHDNELADAEKFMPDFKDVSLDPATITDAVLLSNLLELYIHDLSEAFPNVQLGLDGRFGYPKLPLYWSEHDRRFAFIIKCDARVAGFVFATRGSPVTEDPDTFDVAEFFVVRQYRHCGVGRQAAHLLWIVYPGSGPYAFHRETQALLPSGVARLLA